MAALASDAAGRRSDPRMTRASADLEAVITATRSEVAADALRIALAGLAAAVVLAIARAREREFAAASRVGHVPGPVAATLC